MRLAISERRREGDRPRALVLRALGLGDLLTAVPALRGIRAALPGHRVTLATSPGLAPVVGLADCVDELLPVDGLAPLRWPGPPPDVAINLHGSGPQSHALLRQLRPGRLLAFACPDDGQWGPAEQGPAEQGPAEQGPDWRPDEHEAHRWARLVRDTLGVPVEPAALDLRRPDVTSPAPGAVVVHPGAAYGSRRWPPDRFAAVAAELHARGHHVVVSGSGDEAPIARLVTAGAGLPAADDLAGRLRLLELAALVADARLVVAGDTGVAHLATAYRTPSVVLFGPATPARWAPPPGRQQHAVLWRGRPGQGEGDRFADHPGPELLAITVDEVLAAAARALAGVPAVPVG